MTRSSDQHSVDHHRSYAFAFVFWFCIFVCPSQKAPSEFGCGWNCGSWFHRSWFPKKFLVGVGHRDFAQTICCIIDWPQLERWNRYCGCIQRRSRLMVRFLANTVNSETFTTTFYLLYNHSGRLCIQFPAQGQWQPHVFDLWCVCFAFCVRGLFCATSCCSVVATSGFEHFVSLFGFSLPSSTLVRFCLVWFNLCFHGSLQGLLWFMVYLFSVQYRLVCFSYVKVGDGGHKKPIAPHSDDIVCGDTCLVFGSDLGWSDIVSNIMGSVRNGGPFQKQMFPSFSPLVHFGINVWGGLRRKGWNGKILSWGSNIRGFKCEGVWRWYSQPILAIVCLFLSFLVSAIKVWCTVADHNFVLCECCISNASPAFLWIQPHVSDLWCVGFIKLVWRKVGDAVFALWLCGGLKKGRNSEGDSKQSQRCKVGLPPVGKSPSIGLRLVQSLVLFAFLHVGEAHNPGPKVSNCGKPARSWSIGVFNPSGLGGKHQVISNYLSECDIWAVSETHLTSRGFHSFRNSLKWNSAFQFCVGGAPVPLRSHSDRSGEWSGVAMLSKYPTRQLPVKWPQQTQDTSRVLITTTLCADLWITGAVLYGEPPGATHPNAQHNTDLMAHDVFVNLSNVGGLRFFAGDFNFEKGGLDIFQTLESAGFRDMQDMAFEKWGIHPQKTCKQSTRKDFCFLSPELQRYLVDVQVDATIWADHAVRKGTFRGEPSSFTTYHWRVPMQAEWPPDFQCDLPSAWFRKDSLESTYTDLWTHVEHEASVVRVKTSSWTMLDKPLRQVSSDLSLFPFLPLPMKVFTGENLVGRYAFQCHRQTLLALLADSPPQSHSNKAPTAPKH